MPLLKQESDFKTLVLESYDALPPQQQVVADFFLEHLGEIPLLSVPDLASRCGASEATIVRFAQRIGYDGFASLKAELLEAVREKVLPVSNPGPAFARVPEGEPLSEVAKQEIHNIERSIAGLDREELAEVADKLFEAAFVHWFGMGISSHLAGLGAYLLTQLGMRSRAIPTHFTSPLEPLVALGPSDAVLVLSFPPYSTSTLEVAETARQRGATTVALVDRPTAPAARIAHHTLSIHSENMMYTNSFAAVSVVLNGLVTAIAMRNPQAVARSVSELTGVFHRTHRVSS